MLGLLTKDKSEKVAPGAEERPSETKVSPVVKVIEIVATSRISFDDAIASGVKTAARSLRNITGADVKHMTVAIEDGAVSEYRVDLKVAFALDDEDDD